MIRSIAALAVCALVACGPKHATTTVLTDDHAVIEGGGWSQIEQGSWQFALVEPGETPTMNLQVEPGGRGMERVDLPAGATGGQIAAIEVVYTSPGAGTWTIYPVDGDRPADFGVGVAHATVTGEQVGGWSSVVFSPAAAVTGSFFVVFESADDALSVGALEEDRHAQVSYQPADGEVQATPYTPFLRVTLTGVH